MSNNPIDLPANLSNAIGAGAPLAASDMRAVVGFGIDDRPWIGLLAGDPDLIAAGRTVTDAVAVDCLPVPAAWLKRYVPDVDGAA